VIRLLLDENVDVRLQKALSRRSPDVIVWAVGAPGAPRLQSSDPEVLSWCETRGFILVTNNRASMSVHLRNHLAAGRHMPGIFVLNPNMTLRPTVDELTLICAASEPDEYVDLLLYMPLTA
jgi:hypothetical protein